MIDKLKSKIKGIKYLPFEQDGKTYNLYDMPKGFVIKGDVNLSGQGLTELPDLSEVVVERNFICNHNQLTCLKGAPKKVGGNFYCDHNQLTTLEGAPQTVGGDFDCSHNQLTDLYGAPNEAGRGFNCSYNQLTSLEGGPQKVGDAFECYENPLSSLSGLPSLKGNYSVYCDDSLGEKYGFTGARMDGISYDELYDNSVYQEDEAEIIEERRQQQKERAEKVQKVTEVTKAAFDAWLKKKGIEIPKR